ncbi:hypothetical protein J6590_021114 [Homalodisca vitripennis]|nr:hypothetical protein J6590_021114 [Homalodisca vitripennis]
MRGRDIPTTVEQQFPRRMRFGTVFFLHFLTTKDTNNFGLRVKSRNNKRSEFSKLESSNETFSTLKIFVYELEFPDILYVVLRYDASSEFSTLMLQENIPFFPANLLSPTSVVAAVVERYSFHRLDYVMSARPYFRGHVNPLTIPLWCKARTRHWAGRHPLPPISHS